ncbi:sigma 54-interacting transcriptional regulator [Litorimonas sp. RW-G-Af-16]|uniref:sigma 54-interacting transcriptional regulator n=1 Tax=Litorimonas sp. RW-G-Af-16 TaxID=3241168 RepID=UPI00390C7A9A
MASLPQQPIGQSESFMSLMDRVSDCAVLSRPVLIVGEEGTGKEMIAARVHFLSPRWEQVMITVNCAAFTDQELDVALFGSSLMDGRDETNGRFFAADGGTLLLDNIDSVSPRLQEKLMRAIEYGQYEARGEAETQDVDVRVVAATNVDLTAAVKAGTFRSDLLYRLAFDVLHLPPLRERTADILPLAEHFGKKMASELGGDRFPGFTAETAEKLLRHDWPGNVRELKSVVERNTAKAWLADEALVQPIATLQFDPFDSPYRLRESTGRVLDQPPDPETPADTEEADAPLKAFTERVMEFERRLIDEALQIAENHQGRAADYLDLSYHQFRGLLRKHGLKK